MCGWRVEEGEDSNGGAGLGQSEWREMGGAIIRQHQSTCLCSSFFAVNNTRRGEMWAEKRARDDNHNNNNRKQVFQWGERERGERNKLESSENEKIVKNSSDQWRGIANISSLWNARRPVREWEGALTKTSSPVFVCNLCFRCALLPVWCVFNFVTSVFALIFFVPSRLKRRIAGRLKGRGSSSTRYQQN